MNDIEFKEFHRLIEREDQRQRKELDEPNSWYIKIAIQTLELSVLSGRDAKKLLDLKIDYAEALLVEAVDNKQYHYTNEFEAHSASHSEYWDGMGGCVVAQKKQKPS